MSYQAAKTFYTESEFESLLLEDYEGKYKYTLNSSCVLGGVRETNRFKEIILKCKCDQIYSIRYANFVANCSKNKDLDCGCIKAKDRELKIKQALEKYNLKQCKSKENPHYCTYCGSYRESISKSGMSECCDNCKFLINNKVYLGKSFEDIMLEWNPSCDDENYKYLPVLSGNVRKGFEVIARALIDAELYAELSKLLWVAGGYGYVQASMSKENLKRIDKNHLCYTETTRQVKLHRVVLGIHKISAKHTVGDHINGDKRDNRSCNLRISTPQENSINSKKYRNNKTGFIGVDFCGDVYTKPYRARLYRNGKSFLRKCYASLEEAAKAYDTHLRENFPSEFNVYNFPEKGERGKDGNILIE